MKIELDLNYRGDRNYLQGGDFYIALTNASKDYCNDPKVYVKKLTFRNFARTCCEIVSIKPSDFSRLIGEVRFSNDTGSKLWDAWIIEKENDVIKRKEFNEELLLSKAVIDSVKRVGILHKRSKYMPIDDIIALTKCINYAVAPKISGTWVFGQIDLEGHINIDYKELKVEINSLIPGRFTLNNIFLDGRHTGNVRFIVGNP